MIEFGYGLEDGKIYQLTGVQYKVHKEVGNSYDVSDSLSFILNGRMYTAIEDPKDGYRSSMRELVFSDDTSEMINKFPPIDVKVSISETNYEYMIRLLNPKTGNIILEVGTDYSCDYYPSFVARFNPKAVEINNENIIN